MKYPFDFFVYFILYFRLEVSSCAWKIFNGVGKSWPINWIAVPLIYYWYINDSYKMRCLDSLLTITRSTVPRIERGPQNSVRITWDIPTTFRRFQAGSGSVGFLPTLKILCEYHWCPETWKDPILIETDKVGWQISFTLWYNLQKIEIRVMIRSIYILHEFFANKLTSYLLTRCQFELFHPDNRFQKKSVPTQNE